MSENTTALQTTPTEDLETELTPAQIISELVGTAFGDNTTVTPYKVATIINGAFEVLGVAKVIPTQMMYNYARNGLIVKGKKGAKAYTQSEVTAFVTKYVGKYNK